MRSDRDFVADILARSYLGHLPLLTRMGNGFSATLDIYLRCPVGTTDCEWLQAFFDDVIAAPKWTQKHHHIFDQDPDNLGYAIVNLEYSLPFPADQNDIEALERGIQQASEQLTGYDLPGMTPERPLSPKGIQGFYRQLRRAIRAAS